MILIADKDHDLCASVAQFLDALGYATVVANDSDRALAAYRKHKPRLIIADIHFPFRNGFHSFDAASPDGFVPPFIITTDSEKKMGEVIDSFRQGTRDFLVKPFPLDLLHKKIRHLIGQPTEKPASSTESALDALHQAIRAVSGKDSIEQLLDAILNSCIKLSKADGGSLELVNKAQNRLMPVRKITPGRRQNTQLTKGSTIDQSASNWVNLHNRSLLIAKGHDYPDISFSGKENGSLIGVPLRIADEIIGVLTVNRLESRPVFTHSDLKMVEVFAASAANEIRNRDRYDCAGRKLEELSLIGAYSEKLMGLVDKREIIQCFFETARNHFPFDMIGFVLVRKRFHQFLYWAKRKVPDGKLVEITADVVDRYNLQTGQNLMVKRVSPLLFMGPEDDSRLLEKSFSFSEITPVAWEDYNFGAAFFAAHQEMENREGVMSLLSSLISQTRIALTNARLYNDMKENYIRTIKALAIAVDAKDTYTHGHSENVMNIAESIARELSSDEKWIGTIRDAGLLHDIGKIGIPGYILNKPGPLTYEEFNGIMKTHTTLGANIVRDVPFLQDLYSLILYHHEHYDGSGYPEGIERENIPLGARILHVSDAFEAMTSNRPYRNSLGKKEAFKRLREQKGKQFDPKIVEIFERVAVKKGWLEKDSQDI